MARKTYRTGVITLKDGAGTPKTLVLTFDKDFTVDIPGVDIIINKDRGQLPAAPDMVLGDEQEITGGFSVLTDDITDAAAAALMDIINAQSGGGWVGANWVSTVSSPSGLFAVDIVYNDGTGSFTLEDCIIRGKYTEGEVNKIECTFVCPHPYPSSLT